MSASKRMRTVPGRAFSSADWLRALTLRERQASLEVGARAPEGAGEGVDASVERWRSELSLAGEAEYAGWLERNGWDDGLFRALLADPGQPGAVVQCPLPPWLAEIAAAYTADEETATESPFEGSAFARPRVFVALAEPLVRRAIARVRAAVGGMEEVPFDPQTVHTLFLPSLGWHLARRLDRTLTQELHVARLKGLLSGATPEERFQSFTPVLLDRRYAVGLLRKYPVLARQLVQGVRQWADSTVEFLQRLHRDWAELREHFGGSRDPGRLTAVQADAGDTHRDGRAVKVVTFESGLKLVYKPHSLDVDRHFHELVAWLNARGFQPALRVPLLLTRPGYGWSEFVPAAPCGSAQEVERFFERQGALLALLHALEAIDIHYENLIASGEHPVLVDLEALFHPRPSKTEARIRTLGVAYGEMSHTVLRVGLLPQRSGRSSAAAFDGSGLGGGAEQLSPFPVLHFENEGTDQMRMVRRHIKIPGQSNQAQLNGRAANAFEYGDSIVAGFSRVHALLRSGREELLAPGGLLDRFAEDEVRVVLRATRTYLRVLIEASHPTLLSDAADHERLLQRIGDTVPLRPYLEPVIADEIADLQAGDVPAFSSRPSSRDLWSSRGRRIPDYFQRASLDNVRRRVAALDEADLARQCWFIRAALTTLSLAPHEGRTGNGVFVRPEPPAQPSPFTPGRALAAASALAERLDELAVREDAVTSWIGIELTPQEFWALEPVGFHLFGGTAGIALFFGYLGQAARQSRHTELALSLATQAQEAFSLYPDGAQFSSVGPFAGWSGWMYTLAHLAWLTGKASLLDVAHSIRERVVAHVDEDETLDVIGGSAGLIGALAALQACAPSRAVLADIAHCADRLVQRAQPGPRGGLAWATAMPSFGPLTGFSHGASGMAWALAQAADLTENERYLEVARAAAEYERSLFLPEVGNWPDLRKMTADAEAADSQPMTTWCHGAPGIGLSRLRSLPLLDGPELRTDLEQALQTTLAHGFGGNHCLCHGDLGNLQLVLEAGRALARPELTQQAWSAAARIGAVIGESGPVCGTPAAVQVPGLMTGLAGIGLALLRLADPDATPSVLTLDPPPAARPRPAPRTIRRAAALAAAD